MNTAEAPYAAFSSDAPRAAGVDCARDLPLAVGAQVYRHVNTAEAPYAAFSGSGLVAWCWRVHLSCVAREFTGM